MRRTSTLTVLLALMSSSVWAQTVPDAGSLMRQTEQMLRPNPGNSPRREALPSAMTINESTSIDVKRIRFVGHQHLGTAQLQEIAAPFENRTLRQTDLMQLTHAVTEAYRQTGWVINAYVPRQSLTNGDLTLQVIETIPPTRTP